MMAIKWDKIRVLTAQKTAFHLATVIFFVLWCALCQLSRQTNFDKTIIIITFVLFKTDFHWKNVLCVCVFCLSVHRDTVDIPSEFCSKRKPTNTSLVLATSSFGAQTNYTISSILISFSVCGNFGVANNFERRNIRGFFVFIDRMLNGGMECFVLPPWGRVFFKMFTLFMMMPCRCTCDIEWMCDCLCLCVVCMNVCRLPIFTIGLASGIRWECK